MLAAMETEGKLKTHVFSERDQLLKLAEPVKKAYAKEIDATEVLEAIDRVR